MRSSIAKRVAAGHGLGEQRQEQVLGGDGAVVQLTDFALDARNHAACVVIESANLPRWERPPD